MEGSRLEEDSSPLATSEDIQKRLVRPPPLHSQPSSSSAASAQCSINLFDDISRSNSSKLNSNFEELQKKNREVNKTKRLEDYLDPLLLSTIRAKIGVKRKNYGVEIKKTTKSELKDFDWFEWPGDHHELMALSGSSRGSESSKVKPDDKNDILDLKIDSDSIGYGTEEREQSYCTPFQRFERAATKQFKS